MSSPNASIAQNEQILLNLIKNEPTETIILFDRNYFISDLAKNLFVAIKECYLSDMDISNGNIIIHGAKLDGRINNELLENLNNVVYNTDDFQAHFKILKKQYAKNLIQNKILKETVIETSKKGELDIAKLESLKDEITECIDLIAGRDSLLISLDSMFDKYHEILLRRKKGELLYETGDGELDKKLLLGFAPHHMTTIIADSGVGKSVVTLNIANKQINKQIPCIYISLENNLEMTMDRLVAMRCGINAQDLYFKGEYHNEHIFDKFIEERNRLKNCNHFMMVEEGNLSLNDIEMIIKEAKIKMKTDYLCVFLDLQSMVSDFSEDINAQSIEQAVNKQHRLAKRQNVHFVNVLQTNGTASDFKPKTVKDCNNFRFSSISNIKNARAFGERSRAVIGVIRPKLIATNVFGSDNAEVEIMEDRILLQCIKNNQSALFTLQKLFIPERFQIFNIKREEGK